jgi:hypothetical protein
MDPCGKLQDLWWVIGAAGAGIGFIHRGLVSDPGSSPVWAVSVRLAMVSGESGQGRAGSGRIKIIEFLINRAALTYLRWLGFHYLNEVNPTFIIGFFVQNPPSHAAFDSSISPVACPFRIDGQSATRIGLELALELPATR